MPHTRHDGPRRPSRLIAGWTLGAAIALGIASGPAHAQRSSPVYLDDAPSAEEALSRAGELSAVGNLDEAARVLHGVLERSGENVAPTRADPDLFVSIRTLAHDLLLSNPDLIDRYAALHEDLAAARVDLGEARSVERAMLLTPSGHEATLRVTQQLLEDARFDAAWRTLIQLERHPSRTGPAGRDAAEMLQRVESYRWTRLDEERRERSLERLARWRTDAGMPGGDRIAPADAPNLPTAQTPLDDGPAVRLDGVLTKPVASARLGDGPESLRPLASDPAKRRLPERAKVLQSFPVIVGDLVFTNDSETVSAFDRFTLNRRWRSSVIGPPTNGSGHHRQSGLEDPSAVAVSPPHVAALMGLSLMGRQAEERTLTVFDERTGEPRWMVRLSESDDPRLEGGLLRGPAAIEEGLVIVSVVRSVTRHRLLGAALAAFDVETGAVEWVRPIGSVGFVPWAMNPEVVDPPLIQDGVIYRADRLGVIAAIEAATGRPLWMRRVPRALDRPGRVSEPWEGNKPVMAGDRVAALSPDRRLALVMDAETGEILDSYTATQLGAPLYLLTMRDHLVAVGFNQIASRPLDGLSDPDTDTHLVGTFTTHGIRGRVSVMGDTLLVPAYWGVRAYAGGLVTGEDKDGEPTDYELMFPGAFAATEGQLVVVDDQRVHSYLSWDIAERLLRSRMAEAPLDPRPAVTFAELAYRAGRMDSILEAVDSAMRAIEVDPLSPRSEVSRGDLFRSMLEMIEPPTPRPEGQRLGADLRETVLDRLGRLASAPEEQVSFLLAAGRLYENTDRAALAVERYQEVLGSPALAGAIYTERSTRLPAETEATRRLRALLRLEGRGAYAAYEQEAGRLLAELGGSGDAEAYERIARRYPVSTHAPSAWRLAATRRFAGGQTQQGVFALEEGITSAADTRGVGDPLLGELAGELITRLVDEGRLAPAAFRLAQLLEERPGLELRAGGEVVDTLALRQRISSLIAQRERRPLIGAELGETSILSGWFVVEPNDQSNPDRPTDRLLMASGDGRRAMWVLNPEGELEAAWAAPPDGELLRMDHRSVYFSGAPREHPSRRWVARHDLETGEQIWKTRMFADLFTGVDGAGLLAGSGPRVDTPLERARPLSDLFLLFDALALVMVERTGRAASFDLESGRLLWAHDLGPAPLQPVHDAEAGGGVVAMGGLRILPPEARPQGESSFQHMVVVLDSATGELLYEHEEPEPVRWVRVSPEGPVLCGTNDAVISIDAFRRALRWRNEDESMRDTFGAWVFAGRAVLRDINDALYLLDTNSGRSLAALRHGERLLPGFQFARVAAIGDRSALATAHGVALWDENGELIGLDERRQLGKVLQPRFAESYAVTLSTDELPLGGNDFAYDLTISDLVSLKAAAPPTPVELGVPPRSLSLIDGHVVISAGQTTVIIDAPRE